MHLSGQAAHLLLCLLPVDWSKASEPKRSFSPDLDVTGLMGLKKLSGNLNEHEKKISTAKTTYMFMCLCACVCKCVAQIYFLMLTAIMWFKRLSALKKRNSAQQ